MVKIIGRNRPILILTLPRMSGQSGEEKPSMSTALQHQILKFTNQGNARDCALVIKDKFPAVQQCPENIIEIFLGILRFSQRWQQDVELG